MKSQCLKKHRAPTPPITMMSRWGRTARFYIYGRLFIPPGTLSKPTHHHCNRGCGGPRSFQPFLFYCFFRNSPALPPAEKESHSLHLTKLLPVVNLGIGRFKQEWTYFQSVFNTSPILTFCDVLGMLSYKLMSFTTLALSRVRHFSKLGAKWTSWIGGCGYKFLFFFKLVFVFSLFLQNIMFKCKTFSCVLWC